MSTPVKNQIVATSPAAEKKVKAPRKPTLSAKYSKFLVGNYNMIQMLSAKGLLTDEAVETAYNDIKLFDSIEDQTAFYEASIESAKATTKQMKKFVTQRLKPPKAPRAKKAPKADKPAKVAAAGGEVKAKKPRTKKEVNVADDTKQDLVAQLVEAANAPMTPPAEAPVEAPAAPKKARKPRVKKVAAPVALFVDEDNKEEAAPAAPAPKAKKPRAKKVKTPASPIQVAEPEPIQVAEDEDIQVAEDEEEIHTQEITIGDTTYLIDTENNLYSIDTHDQIGTFNADTNEVVAC